MNKKELYKITGLFVGWRVSLFIIPRIILSIIQSVTSSNILKYDPSFPYAENILKVTGLPQWLYSWGNFDGVHYITIATKGYFGTGLIQAFFPLYPMLVKTGSLLIPDAMKGDTLLTAVIISTFFAWLSVLLFYKLVKKDYPKYAWTATIIYLLFPTSFFLGAIYNESLFLSLVFGSFLMARNKSWFWAGVLASLASATRIVGIFLVPALLIELWMQYREVEKPHIDIFHDLKVFLARNVKNIISILIGSLGLISYMIHLQYSYGDFLYFLHVQSEFGAGRQESIIIFPQVVWRYIKILMTSRPFDFKYYSYVQDFIISIGSMIILTLAIFPKSLDKLLKRDNIKENNIRLSYIVFSFFALILPTLTGTFSSMPRYTLVAFPIFIWLAIILQKRRILLISYLTISTFLLILNTILFLQGYWVS